jgi:heptaprenylglyceryl phosphate synthase
VCHVRQQNSRSGGASEKEFITKFISYMENVSPDYEGLMNSVSPEYIRTHNIDKSLYKVDNFFVTGKSIEEYSAEGYVIVKIWGEGRSWVHQLTFKLTREKGKLYIMPSAHSEKYITPWWDKKQYVKE